MASSSPKTSKVADGSSSTTFPFFRALPLEIQIKIWEQAIPEPRIIEIHEQQYCLKKYKSRWRWEHAQLTYVTDVFVPAILHANRESRRVGLKYYTLGLGNPKDMFHGGEHTIYVDYERDTIYFREGQDWSLCRPGKTYHTEFIQLRNCFTRLTHTFNLFMSKLEEPTHRKIRKIAIDLYPKMSHHHLHFKWFSELRELTFIANEDDGNPDVDTKKDTPSVSESDLRYRTALKFVDVEDRQAGDGNQTEI